MAFWYDEVKLIINPCIGNSNEDGGCHAFVRTHGIVWVNDRLGPGQLENITDEQAGKIVKREVIHSL